MAGHSSSPSRCLGASAKIAFGITLEGSSVYRAATGTLWYIFRGLFGCKAVFVNTPFGFALSLEHGAWLSKVSRAWSRVCSRCML